MDTHQPTPPPVSLLYTAATRGREAIFGVGGVTLYSSGTGGACASFSLNVNILGKTAVLHLVPFCSWVCANSSVQFIGHNYACSFLQFGTVLNSNSQLIQYTFWFPTLGHTSCGSIPLLLCQLWKIWLLPFTTHSLSLSIIESLHRIMNLCPH
jgi:hypothetical protein